MANGTPIHLPVPTAPFGHTLGADRCSQHGQERGTSHRDRRGGKGWCQKKDERSPLSMSGGVQMDPMDVDSEEVSAITSDII